jgi:hypothetical protein
LATSKNHLWPTISAVIVTFTFLPKRPSLAGNAYFSKDQCELRAIVPTGQLKLEIGVIVF